MYTFQDWLDDKPLSESYPHRNHHFHKNSISMELLVRHGEMTKDDLRKVREAQEWTYDKSIEINVSTYKEMFLNELQQSINGKKLIKVRLKQIKSVLQKHPEETNRVLKGGKYYFDIKSKDYLILKDSSKQTNAIRVNNHSFIEFQLLWEKWIEEIKNEWSSKSQGANSESSTSEQTTTTKDIIEEQFESMHINKGWEYAFKNEDDYCTYTNLLVNFFEQKEYILPVDVISLRLSCKTRLAKTLNEIYKELAEVPLKSNIEFLDLVKVLKPFADDPDLYNTLKR